MTTEDNTGITTYDSDEDEIVLEEKKELISQILGLQNTLDALATKVDTVKEENLKLKAENEVLGQFIESLMTASNVFQSAEGQGRRKK